MFLILQTSDKRYLYNRSLSIGIISETSNPIKFFENSDYRVGYTNAFIATKIVAQNN